MASQEQNRLLVVDDDPLVARLIAAYLEGDGHVVFSATDGPSALEMVERHQPSIVITDWEMPGFSGLELCRRVRGLDLPNYVYIIFVTQRSGDADLSAAMEAGADDLIAKPLRKQELSARLNAGARIVRLQSHLAQLADEDTLTKLLLRRPFNLIASREWNRSVRGRLSLSVALIDIDHFKQVNDTHGHPAGDEVLRRVAQAVSESVRSSDSAARVGGEEMCVLLPETDEHSAAIWAERLRKKVAAIAVPVATGEVRVTISIGLASVVADVEDFDQLVQLCDQCLLAAKQLGRNRVVTQEQLAAMSEEVGASASRAPAATVREAMAPLVHYLRADLSIPHAAVYLLEHRATSAPIIDDRGSLVGIISDKDLLQIRDKPQHGVTLADVMQTNVITYDVNAPLKNLFVFMARASLRSVVVTEHGRPCGLVSRASLVRWLVDNVWGRPPEAGLEAESPQADRALLAIAAALCEEAERLRDYLAQGIDDQGPMVLVGSASKMQQLTSEVLANSTSVAGSGRGLPN